MATPNIVPRADSEGGIGTSSKYWASAYIDAITTTGDVTVGGTLLVTGDTAAGDDAAVGYTSAEGLILTGQGSSYDVTIKNDADEQVITIPTGTDDVYLQNGGNLRVLDNGYLQAGTGADLYMYHNGTNSFFGNLTGNLTISNGQVDGDIILQADNGSGTATAYLTLDGSAGYTTVQKAIRFEDDVQLQLGTDRELVISSDGSNGIIANQIGNLHITNAHDDGDIIFNCDNGSGGTAAYLTLDGSQSIMQASRNLVFNDSVTAAFGNGADMDIKHDATNSFIQNHTGDLTIKNFQNDGDIIFQSDDGAGATATYFYLDGSSAAHSGSATTALYTNWPDNSNISLGTGHDLQIVHNGSNSTITNATGHVYITNNADDSDIVFQSDNGSGGVMTYLYLDGSAAGYVRIPDNGVLALGDGADLILRHDASNSYIQNQGAGNLIIENQQDDGDIIFQSDDGAGGVATYFALDGGQATHSGSATTALYTMWPDKSTISLGDSKDFQFAHNGAESSILNNTGNLKITQSADDGDIIFQSDDGSGGTAVYLTLDGGVKRNILNQHTNAVDDMGIYVGTGLDFGMYHDGTHTYLTNDSGAGSNLYIRNATNDADVIFECDNGSGGLAAYLTLDGSAGVISASKNFKFPDSIYALFGDSSDLEIYHDGSNSYIKDTGTGVLKIRGDNMIVFGAPTGGENYATFIKDGACQLRHNDLTRFATTATGISVTGATGTAEGGGIDASDAVSIQVGEINGEIITTIFVDIGIGSIQSSSTNTGAIGNGTDAAAYITQVTTAINGIVYKAELICVEVPAVASGALNLDIDLSANASSIASGSAVSGTPVCESAGSATLGRLIKNTAAITPDHYLYLAQSGTNAGVYNAGQFIIKLYGAAAL